MKGIFITIEGPDGAGKTTQRELLKEYLEKKGYDVLITRDPGGNPISEAIREVILNKDFTEMGYMTELLLYASARAQLVKENIKPALDAGQAVIADRFVDSSAVYQGIGRGLGVDTVYKVNEFALQGIMPDMTFLMSILAIPGRTVRPECMRHSSWILTPRREYPERRTRLNLTEWRMKKWSSIRRSWMDTACLRICTLRE